MSLRYIPNLAMAALIALALVSPVQAASQPVIEACIANDAAALAALSHSAATAQERALATGALMALRREDAAAIRMLTAITRSTARPDVRATALLALAGIYIRDGRYRASYSATRAALELSPRLVQASDRQAMAFARVLEAVRPMQLTRAASGSLEITRDKAGLDRVPVHVNGYRLGAIIDTGAAFSTISASTARKAGIRLLRPTASVGSSTQKAVASRIGIARRLRIGNAVLTNVVFIVLPDSALTFANGAYKIDAIIGVPVFLALGRIEIADSGKKAEFDYGAPDGLPAGQARYGGPDMLLSGLQPLILAQAPGASEPLRMFLDTGANVTSFNRNLVKDVPALVARVGKHAYHVEGAGGAEIDQQALRLPAATLLIGGRRFELENVSVASSVTSGNDGAIGLDLIRQGSRMILDFRTMTFTVAADSVR